MELLSFLISIYILILFARGIFSFVVQPGRGGLVSEINHVLIVLTEPLLVPIRRLIGVHRVGGAAIDWSPLILIILLAIIRAAL
jgi:uncharacterized protein YggT (Ycf19 family)